MWRLALLLFAGCATVSTAPTVPPAEWLPDDAVTGVDDPALRAAVARHWAWYLKTYPLDATEIGVRRYDRSIGDRSAAGFEEERRIRRELLAEIDRTQAGSLNPRDSVTASLLAEYLGAANEMDVCAFEEWSLSPRSNPVTVWNYLPELHAIRSKEDATNLLARYRLIGRAIDDSSALLSRGAARGLVTNAETARRVIAMVRAQLDKPGAEWPLVTTLEARTIGRPDDERAPFLDEVRRVVDAEVRPALSRHLDVLEKEILPKARPEESSGLLALPIGERCYAAAIRRYTHRPRPAKEIHEIGLAEIARINGEMRALGGRLFGTEGLPEILHKLRTDRGLYFAKAEEVESKAARALAAAKVRIPEFFGVLPKADCVISRIPEYEAPFTTVAYYRAPIPDGTRPGQYYVNVYAPETRPRFEAEALAFHESIPGHHLQIAIAQELAEVPAFRKHFGMEAFTEGWALYTERLADEMGLYGGDLDRMGMLSYESWRAARLVVDTGIHAMGWSRKQAIEYMLAHTALAPNNIDNEVDRYITWPGQALAYKIGQLEITRLREEAKAALGAAFDIREFHDAVLNGGAVSIAVLEGRVRAWIEARAPQS